MIKTIHRVTCSLGGRERVVLETEDIQEARKKDAQMDVALSLLVETERLFKTGMVALPKDLTYQSLEPTLEDLFIELVSDQDGLKRALKGSPYTEPGSEPKSPIEPRATSSKVLPADKKPRQKRSVSTDPAGPK